jgi:hypothetical protein
VSGAKQSLEHRWIFSARYIPQMIDRAKLRFTLTYRLHERITAGLEYNPLADDVHPLANILLLEETRRRPAVIIGTSTDRIGTPAGQAYYLTLSKNLKRETKLPIAPYVGMMYGTYEDRFRPVGGLNVGFTERWTALVTFDGVHVHQLLNYSYKRHVFSFLLVRGTRPGFSYSITF